MHRPPSGAAPVAMALLGGAHAWLIAETGSCGYICLLHGILAATALVAAWMIFRRRDFTAVLVCLLVASVSGFGQLLTATYGPPGLPARPLASFDGVVLALSVVAIVLVALSGPRVEGPASDSSA